VLKEPIVSKDLRKCQVAIVYTDIDVQAAIDAIAEPRRREILCLVRDQEMASGRIAAHFDVTRQAVSQHLRILHDAGLVSERRDGTRRIYRARPEGLAELRAFLDQFWSERLEALRREVEAEHRRRIDDGDRKQ
jgi:DNA-binding transcriptional ArsR family regulator